jgi:CheY-like chemotaxis protein
MPVPGSVLVVNSFECREVDAAFLAARSIHVDVAKPADALAQLHTAQPDVVVTDTVFRGTDIDGVGLIRELRRRLGGATSIIVVSGRARREDREQARAAGADCFLLKPVLPNTLLYEVRRALAVRHQGRRLPWNWGEAPVPSPDRPRTLQRAPAAPLAPAAEAIAARAFDHFAARGAEHGHDIEDWLRAERELAAERRSVRRRS